MTAARLPFRSTNTLPSLELPNAPHRADLARHLCGVELRENEIAVLPVHRPMVIRTKRYAVRGLVILSDLDKQHELGQFLTPNPVAEFMAADTEVYSRS